MKRNRLNLSASLEDSMKPQPAVAAPNEQHGLRAVPSALDLKSSRSRIFIDSSEAWLALVYVPLSIWVLATTAGMLHFRFCVGMETHGFLGKTLIR